MRAFRFLVGLWLGVWLLPLASWGGEFHLNNGDIIRGEPVSFNDDGMVVKLDIGGHSPRISWSKFTQESLQTLLTNPQAAKFVEPFIDIPPVPKEKQKKQKDIVVKPVPRVEQVPKTGLFAALAAPAGLAVVFVLLLANLYAAYEIARFRYRPPGLVCGLSLFLPVVAPLIFLAMPRAAAEEVGAVALGEPGGAAPVGKSTTGPLAKVPMASGLSLQHGEKAAASAAQQQPTYKRGEFTFNRRFMESKFASFFRVVQSEADKDLVLWVRTNKDEFVAKRISRISSTDVHLQLLRGTEVSVGFADIGEIQVRHKDAKT